MNETPLNLDLDIDLIIYSKDTPEEVNYVDVHYFYLDDLVIHRNRIPKHLAIDTTDSLAHKVSRKIFEALIVAVPSISLIPREKRSQVIMQYIQAMA